MKCSSLAICRPVSRFSTILDLVEKWAFDIVARRVTTVDDTWFDRAVRQPRMGRVYDFLAAPGKFATHATILFVATVAATVLSLWLVAYAALFIAVNPSAPSNVINVIFAIVGELVWFTPIFLVLAAIGSACDGVDRGFREWKLRYQQAQTAEWCQRHPRSGAYCVVGWRYSRD